MLDIKYIRENLKDVTESAKNKGYTVDFDLLLKLDDERRALLSEVETLRTSQNKISNNKGTKPSAAPRRSAGSSVISRRLPLKCCSMSPGGRNSTIPKSLCGYGFKSALIQLSPQL